MQGSLNPRFTPISFLDDDFVTALNPWTRSRLALALDATIRKVDAPARTGDPSSQEAWLDASRLFEYKPKLQKDPLAQFVAARTAGRFSALQAELAELDRRRYFRSSPDWDCPAPTSDTNRYVSPGTQSGASWGRLSGAKTAPAGRIATGAGGV